MLCATDISRGATITNLVQGVTPGSFTAANDTILASSTKLRAGGVRIMYQASDTAAIALATGPTFATAVTTSAIVSTGSTGGSKITTTIGLTTVYITPTAASAISTSSAAAKSSSGLSTGAKAGIAVGCVIAGLALLLLGFFFFRKRGKQREKQEMTEQNTGKREDDVATMESPTSPTTNGSFLEKSIVSPVSPVQEMLTPINAHEMGTMLNHHELETKGNVHESPVNQSGFRGYPDEKSAATLNNPMELINGYAELDGQPKEPSLYGSEKSTGTLVPVERNGDVGDKNSPVDSTGGFLPKEKNAHRNPGLAVLPEETGKALAEDESAIQGA